MSRLKGVPQKPPAFAKPKKPACIRKMGFAAYGGDECHAHWTPAAYLAMDAAFTTAVRREHPEYRTLAI